MNNFYLIYLINMLMIMILNILIILISVAFLTLFERKILGYIQLRKGPNKVFYMGIFQPFSDAIKLFNKENFFILKSNYFIYLLSPMFSLLLMLMIWLILPFYMNLYSMNLGFIYMTCIFSISVYLMMMSGWSSNSIYSLIGSLRSIAQTISYEVSMILIMLSLMILIENFNFINFYYFQKNNIFIIMMFPLALMLMVSLLAELNRTPFDLVEGESELVSGFNIEYMSGSFAMIFISEYGMILFSSFLFSMFFLKCNIMNLMFYMKFMIMNLMIIWIRGTYPRIRYDNLMYLTWKFYLFYSLILLMIMLLMKLMMII